MSITGLVLGMRSRTSPGRAMAIAGIVMPSVGLVLTTMNGGVAAYLAVRRDLGP